MGVTKLTIQRRIQATNTIAQKASNVQTAGTISRFMKRRGTGEPLKACNAYMEKD